MNRRSFFKRMLCGIAAAIGLPLVGKGEGQKRSGTQYIPYAKNQKYKNGELVWLKTKKIRCSNSVLRKKLHCTGKLAYVKFCLPMDNREDMYRVVVGGSEYYNKFTGEYFPESELYRIDKMVVRANNNTVCFIYKPTSSRLTDIQNLEKMK